MLKANPLWKGYVTSCKILLWILKWQQSSWSHRGHLAASCSFTPGRPLPDPFPTAYQRAAGRPPQLHPTANMRWQSHLGQEAQREQRGPFISKASSPGRSWVRRPGVTGTRAWILLSSFETGTCCHLVPITASMQRDLPTEAPRWRNEAAVLCAWSPENVPSISQLQKHLCPTAFSGTAVKIYRVRLLSEFLTSQPEAGWSGGCQWAAAGSERGHSFQGLDEMWHKGVRGEPGAPSAVDFHQLVIFSSFCIQSTCACWAWCELTWQRIKIWVRVGPQRANNLVRNNRLLKIIQIIWSIFWNHRQQWKNYHVFY